MKQQLTIYTWSLLISIAIILQWKYYNSFSRKSVYKPDDKIDSSTQKSTPGGCAHSVTARGLYPNFNKTDYIEVKTRWLCPIGNSQGSLLQTSKRQEIDHQYLQLIVQILCWQILRLNIERMSNFISEFNMLSWPKRRHLDLEHCFPCIHCQGDVRPQHI